MTVPGYRREDAMSKRTQPKDAVRMNAARKVHVWVLVYENAHAGTFVGCISSSGENVTLTARIWAGPLKFSYFRTATAGGCGYDKLASCLESALNLREWSEEKESEESRYVYPDAGKHGDVPDGGQTPVKTWLARHGYTVIEAL